MADNTPVADNTPAVGPDRPPTMPLWPERPEPVRRSGPPGWIGLLLMIPLTLAWLYGQVWPTIQTLSLAATGHAPLLTLPKVGAGHSGAASLDGAGAAFGRSLLLALIPVLVMLIVVPLLALAANEGGGPLRTAVRLVLVVPLAGFAPAVVAVSWRYATMDGGLFTSLATSSRDSALGNMTVISGLSALGLVCGIGVTALLAALRRRHIDRPGRTLGAALVTWAVLVLGTLAIGLQTVSLVIGVTGGGPGSQTLTSLAYDESFKSWQLSSGAGVNTLLLVPVAVLGLVAGLLVVLGRARMELDPRRERPVGLLPRGSRGLGVVVGVVALVVAVGVVVVVLLPRLSLVTGDLPVGRSPSSSDLAASLVMSLVPAVITTVVQVVLAYLAGIGIGAFRPLGRHSRLLLLPFSPWLFVTVVPLSAVFSVRVIDDKALDSVRASVSPMLASIPALFVFALFAAGQGRRWRERIAAGRSRGAFAATVLLPSLPLAGLVALTILLVEAHSLFWPLIVQQSHRNGSVLLMLLLNQYMAVRPALGVVAVAAPVALVALLGYVVFQLLYLNRIAIRVGPDRRDGTRPDAGPAPTAATPPAPPYPTTAPGGPPPAGTGPYPAATPPAGATSSGRPPADRPGTGFGAAGGPPGPVLGGLPPAGPPAPTQQAPASPEQASGPVPPGGRAAARPADPEPPTESLEPPPPR